MTAFPTPACWAVAAAPTLTGALTPYSFTANRTGNIRLRFSSTNTAGATNPRINLDDISITDYRVSTATKGSLLLPDLTVFPNPAQGGEVLVSGTGRSPVQCALYDLAGRCLLPVTVLPASQLLLLPPVPAGIYLLHISTPEGQRTVRLARQ